MVYDDVIHNETIAAKHRHYYLARHKRVNMEACAVSYLAVDSLSAGPHSRTAPYWRRISPVCSSGDDSWTIPRSDFGRPAVCPPCPAPRDPKLPSIRSDVCRHRAPPIANPRVIKCKYRPLSENAASLIGESLRYEMKPID